MVSGLGPVEVRVTKSQVSFRRRRGFAYVWRPGAYVRSAVPVVLSLALPCEEASPLFKEIAHPPPGCGCTILRFWTAANWTVRWRTGSDGPMRLPAKDAGATGFRVLRPYDTLRRRCTLRP
ncbi:hypothetical protein ARTHRO9AX_220294 [Arthrobacter sp. 9AX]|nr:hypothetical protein ARTHRO9AX_220294 [Arthrobacter sp. 9AX]